jgi:hypothetical protein
MLGKDTRGRGGLLPGPMAPGGYMLVKRLLPEDSSWPGVVIRLHRQAGAGFSGELRLGGAGQHGKGNSCVMIPAAHVSGSTCLY